AGPSGAHRARAEPAAHARIGVDGDAGLCGPGGWRDVSAGARVVPGARRSAAATLRRAAWPVSQPADLERLHVPYRFGQVVIIPAAMDARGHHIGCRRAADIEAVLR